jgi:hypothetical protein
MPRARYRNLVRQAYEAFNARSPAAALATLHEQVRWDDGEGNMLTGHSAVRQHWEQQWSNANPHIDVIDLAETKEGIVARIRFSAAKDGHTEAREITNELTFRDGLIGSMRIG